MAKTLKQTIDQRLAVYKLKMEPALQEYVTDEIVQHILNLTNHSKLPKELYYLVAKMVCEVAEPIVDESLEETVNPLAGVKSLKVGDITVDLSGSSSTAKAKDVDEVIQSLLQDYNRQILSVRKLRW